MSMQPVVGPPPQSFLVDIGRVAAQEHVIITPSGTWPLSHVNVTAQDQTATTTHTPAWAIVMTICTVWLFLLGLLFLLARERRTQGNVAVTVTASNGQMHTEWVQVWNDDQRTDVFNRVAYLQNLIGQARWRATGPGR